MHSLLLGPLLGAPPLLKASLFIFTPEGFGRRKKTSLWFVGSLLAVSVFILIIGLAATTRTENVTVGGYYPGIIVSDKVLGSEGGAPGRFPCGGDTLCFSSVELEV